MLRHFAYMNYRSYRTTFQDFVLQPSNGIVSFSMSDDERVLSEGSDQYYPQLQIDTPTWRPTINRGGRDTKTYFGQLFITKPVIGRDDWAEEDRVLDELEPEMDRLIAWLDYKRKQDWGKITNIGTAFPVKRFENNNLWGWGIELTIEAKANYCHEPSFDVSTCHLFPVWTDGQSLLQIEISGNTYSTQWTDKTMLRKSIRALVDKINADTLTTNIKSQIFLDTLILVHLIPSADIIHNISMAGHTWDPFCTYQTGIHSHEHNLIHN